MATNVQQLMHKLGPFIRLYSLSRSCSLFELQHLVRMAKGLEITKKIWRDLESSENSLVGISQKAFQPEFGAFRGFGAGFEITLEPSELQKEG